MNSPYGWIANYGTHKTFVWSRDERDAAVRYGAKVTPLWSTPPTEKPREFWMYFDDQTGRWVVCGENPKVIRTGAEVIHVREVV